MHVGLQTWGSCFIEDAGLGGPDPYDRHHTPAEFARAYRAFRAWAVEADALGYESFWLTEHHLQREGYEIIPNPIMLGAILAQHTRRIKFGAFFHQVPTWHPIRLAEDLAVADIMSDGRVYFGAGRGSVQREAYVFGATFGRNGDDADRANRELFEEQMALIKLALTSREFSFEGRHYRVPAPGFTNTGHPATGRPWEKVSLVPAPIHEIPIYQAVTSEPTLHYVARERHVGVIPLFNRAVTLPKWRRLGELMAEYQQRAVRPGEDRMLVVHVHIADSEAEAFRRIRDPHDERFRFLAAQRPIGGYLTEDGEPFPFGRIPTLEESVAQAGWFVGTPERVRDGLLEVADAFGLEQVAIEVAYSGMSEADVSEQIARFAREVRPALDAARVGAAAGAAVGAAG
jgi:alkanesulfonate monooxygenase SsuD/methylene tetrahydromethanopterin reductase-like flavin-dependent oxidoreductase (luciferase family)